MLTGITDTPDLVRLKHFGAAAATSGGVEMYHIPGVTAEAQTLEQALGGRAAGAAVRTARPSGQPPTRGSTPPPPTPRSTW